ncbi:hypothetical protein SASPL_100175 [Salvia splendens]|uniref:DNL-type domain-containing protein n=1 Tax=Salvia splendens TaxID=180675 RepID=A0A8X8YSD6_SALSN|nr:uncharacterized protein LOC121793364 [Salvia splendens]KAG6435305.1 hypothetical protein SASPL_100175 [Salvia splendens]
MENITTATTITGAGSLRLFSPFKTKQPSFRRLIRCSISPINGNNSDGKINSGSDLNSDSALAPILRNGTLSNDDAMALVLSAANVGGWTTGSGMEGPPVPAGSDSDSVTERVSTFPWSLFTKSPRRRMRVAFTCNVCGQRTTRAINPHAYTDGTVFVQCCGCNVFHKLVDHLNLFHEMKCYVNSSFNPNPNDNMNIKYLDMDEDSNDNTFPPF